MSRAFGIDNYVARLNYDIGKGPEWSGPYFFSKCIRCIAHPIKICWLATKIALLNLGHTAVRAQICVRSHARNTEDDVEMGEIVRREEAEAHEEIALQSPAMNELRKRLQMVFSDEDRVDDIMRSIGSRDVKM